MNKIDHEHAIGSRAAERYLLGELPEEERDAYEEHFFNCAACAQEVKLGSEFIRSAGQAFRAEASDPATVSPRVASAGFGFSSLFRPLPAFALAAALLLAGLAIYQNVITIPRLQLAAAPQAAAVVSLLAQSARGEGVPEVGVSRKQALSLNIAVPPGFSSYTCQIVGESAYTRSCGLISAQQARDIVPIFVPAGSLSEGKYALVIQGTGENSRGEWKEVARYSFVLKFQN